MGTHSLQVGRVELGGHGGESRVGRVWWGGQGEKGMEGRAGWGEQGGEGRVGRAGWRGHGSRSMRRYCIHSEEGEGSRHQAY